MNILAVHNYYQQPGGEDGVFSAECALLEAHGHAVYRYIKQNSQVVGMNALRLAANTIWSTTAYRELRALIKEKRPSVIHFHNTFPLISPSAYYAAKAEGVPVVQTLHNYRLLCPTAMLFHDGRVCEDCRGKTLAWPGVLRACYRDSHSATAVAAALMTLHRLLQTWVNRVDVFIALTEFARRRFVLGGLPAHRVVVKPNFVYPDPGPSEGRGSHAVFVGRLSQEKGLATLLQAWRGVGTVPLEIVGDGPLREEVELTCRRAPLDRSVQIAGWQPRARVIDAIKAARVLILPSEWYESFPLTILEAFACGTPVIASRLGGMSEIVEHGRTGLLFRPGDPADLAARVEWAWAHQDELAEMGEEARHEYDTKYTAESNYRLLMDIYATAGALATLEGKR